MCMEKQAERSFVADSIVDSTDLMMTSSQLPPTQKSQTHRTFTGVYFITSWRYKTTPRWQSVVAKCAIGVSYPSEVQCTLWH